MVERDTTKTNQHRTVPIPESVVKRLRSELTNDPGSLVFPSRSGGWLPLGELRWIFDQAVRSAVESAEAQRAEEMAQAEDGKAVTPQFPVITPHELRHTTASLAIKAGANIKVLQTLRGHKTATLTLDRNGHQYPDELDVIATALNSGAQTAADRLRTHGATGAR